GPPRPPARPRRRVDPVLRHRGGRRRARASRRPRVLARVRCARGARGRRTGPGPRRRRGAQPRRSARMSTRADPRRRPAPERGRVPPRQLAHVVRRTACLDELVRWYSTVLGATVVHSDGTLAFLTYDDEHHRVAIVGIPGLPDQPATRAGTDHLRFTCAGVDVL